jgi:hypothetical protein
MKSFLRGFARNMISVGMASTVAMWGENPYFLAAAPLLTSIGKGLRNRDSGKLQTFGRWLPF